MAPSSTPPVVSIKATGRVRSTSGTPENSQALQLGSASNVATTMGRVRKAGILRGTGE